jgi:hypothetical protein
MSLYRVASRRSRLFGVLVPAIALVVGLVVGVLAGRSTAPEPSLTEALAGPAAHVDEARTALDVLTIEYPQAVENGEVRAETEYEGAQSDVQRAQEALAAADDLEAVEPSGYRRAAALVAEIAGLVERKAPPAEVEARVRAAEEALAALPGAGSESG